MGVTLKIINAENIINKVYKGSIADEIGIESGDRLLKINGNKIEDILDYKYYITDEYLEIDVLKVDGDYWTVEVEKEYDDDLGIEFNNPIIDEIRNCKTNVCFVL